MVGLCCDTGSRCVAAGVAAGVMVRQARDLIEGWPLSIQPEQAWVNSAVKRISAAKVGTRRPSMDSDRCLSPGSNLIAASFVAVAIGHARNGPTGGVGEVQ
ncbi:MAG: hypothetical protein CMJ75_07920 [Planctomycetaceae bacterium]|nr:hypothetical protein [Planctomycetaceae bacterium]